MSTKKFEIVKRGSVINIGVSSTAYFAIKEHAIRLLEKYNATELLTKIIDTPEDLEDDEYTVKVLLDIVAEIEKAAIANKQTEHIDINITGLPEEEVKDPS
jgi:hypothetical protein